MMKLNRRYIIGFIVFFLALILQTTMLRHIAILGWSPNLLLCLVVVSSFLYSEKIGLVYGIVFGLLLDMVTGQYIGPSAIAFVLIYLFVLAMRQIFNHERLLPELLLAGVSTPLYLLAIWLMYKMAGSPATIFLVLKALPVLIIYNGVIIILLHIVLAGGVVRHKRDKKISGKYELHGGLKL